MEEAGFLVSVDKQTVSLAHVQLLFASKPRVGLKSPFASKSLGNSAARSCVFLGFQPCSRMADASSVLAIGAPGALVLLCRADCEQVKSVKGSRS